MHGSFTGQVAPRVAVARVIGDLREQGALAPETIRNWTHVMGQFAQFLELGHGIRTLEAVDPGIVRAFLTAPSGDGALPNPSVQHLRRCAVRCFYRTARQLGLATGDPTLDVEVPAWRPQVFRPLTDGEVEICRAIAAAGSTGLPRVVWALCEATARTGELPCLTWADLDLDNERVRLPGTKSTAARWGELTDWGLQQLPTRPGRAADRDAPLVPATRRKSPISSSTAVSIVTGILTRAGLDRTMGVRPASIAAWVGRSVFGETGRIDLVATRCGLEP